MRIREIGVVGKWRVEEKDCGVGRRNPANLALNAREEYAVRIEREEENVMGL